MIDLFSDETITLKEAARRLAHLNGGRPPHVSKLYRWCHRGVQGVRLETVRYGGTLVTSVACLRAFVAALSGTNARRPTGTAEDARRRELVDRKLKEYGL